MKISITLFLAFLLAGATSTYAAGNAWVGSGDWMVPANWSLGHVPTASDEAVINSIFGPTLAVDGGTVNTLQVGQVSGFSGTVNFTSNGLLTATSFIRPGGPVDSFGTINISGDAQLVGTICQIGLNHQPSGLGGSGVVNLSDNGVLKVTGGFAFAQEYNYDPNNPAVDGTGVVYIADNAQFILASSQVDSTRAQTFLDEEYVRPAVPGGSVAFTNNGVNVIFTAVSIVLPPLVMGDLSIEVLPDGVTGVLSWDMTAGYDYVLETKATLQDASWTPLPVTGTSGGSVSITGPVSEVKAFYRVSGQ